jgi:chemotaxis protein MotB
VPKKKHHHEEHEEHVNHEAWVIPYADMLTLLMGLFLVLWALSNQDLAKMKEFGESFGKSVGVAGPSNAAATDGKGGDGVLDGSSSPTTAPSIGDADMAMAALQREQAAEEAREVESVSLDRAETTITETAAQVGAAPALTFQREERGLVVSIVSDDVLFEPGSADLRTDGLPALDAVAVGLARLPNTISIEGHTDSRPISTGRFPSNWELSTARAAAVLRYLATVHGLDTSRMVAGGYADQRPQGDNATADGRARNRRVDIAVLSTATAAPAVPSESEGDSDG